MMQVSKKRLVVCCDGTGQDALIATNDGRAWGDGATPLYFTNVLRFSRAVKPYVPDPDVPGGSILQIVYYQSGVGTDSDFRGQSSSAELALELFGTAVARKIRDAYAFIAQNYAPGDEICLIGFSRGAYTARKVAGLINRIGLLPIKDMGDFYAYCYALETRKGQQPPWPKDPVPIHLLGVWETVGSLRTSILQRYPGEVDALSISDSELPPTVRVALHALALHENRNWFQPTLFSVPPPEKMTRQESAQREGQVLKQVWFPGEHSDVGGGWDKHELSDITLMWMASEAAAYIGLDEDTLFASLRPRPDKPRWGTSIPHNGYILTPEALAIIGGIEALNRLSGGYVQPESHFHPSILESPRTSDQPSHHIDSDDDEGNKQEAGKDKRDITVTLTKALGKYMITLDEVIKKFGQHWEPKTIPLNPLEQKARDLWNVPADTTGAPTFESAQQANDLFVGNASAAEADSH